MDLRKTETEKLKEFARKLNKAIINGGTQYDYKTALKNVNAELRYRNTMQHGLWMY